MKHVGIEESGIDRYPYISFTGGLWGMGLMCLGLGAFTTMPFWTNSFHGHGQTVSRSWSSMMETAVNRSTGEEVRSPGTLFIYSFEPWGGVASGSTVRVFKDGTVQRAEMHTSTLLPLNGKGIGEGYSF